MSQSNEGRCVRRIVESSICCKTAVLFGRGWSLELVCAEVPTLNRAVPQDGNELLQYGEFKTVQQTNTKIYFSLLFRGKKCATPE
jgi:hypothetical protein